MNVKVHDLMTQSVVTTLKNKSIEHVRGILERNKISAIPVVDEDNQPIGIVSVSDFSVGLNESSGIESIMTDKVYTIPQYDDISVAARIMRNHKIHRVIVTHEKKITGIISSFDLLKLVEEHRYVEKQPPTVSTRKKAKRV